MASYPRRAVCTTLVGGYEELTEQPAAAESGLSFVCLTDDPDLRSDTWEVRVVEPVLPMDPARSSRRIKMLLHEYVPEFAETLWIDNSIRLLRAPDDDVAAALDGADLAMMPHSFRATVLDEFRAVAEQQLDDPARIDEQLAHYLAVAPEVLDQRPFAGGLIVRRTKPEVIRLMECWWEKVLRYSRRDQLSFNWAATRCGLVPRPLNLPNERSDLHVGNSAAGRRNDRRVDRSVVRAADHDAVLARLHQAEADLRAAAAVTVERDALRDEVASLRPAVAERDEILGTRTWRWTAPTRGAWAMVRGRVRPGPRRARASARSRRSWRG
jgi:hypothetical protein